MTVYVFDRVLGCLIDKATGKPHRTPKKLPRSFRGPMVQADLPEYLSPLSGQPVQGRYARREEMKRYEVREVEPSERPEGAGERKSERQAAEERRQLESRPQFILPEPAKKRLLSGTT